jgi:hypothetical protein
MRFVVLATMLRGALDVPEALDDANQWRAFSAWRQDVSREIRAEFEMRYDDARIVWAKESGRGQGSVVRDQRKPARPFDPRTERMVELARRAGSCRRVA